MLNSRGMTDINEWKALEELTTDSLILSIDSAVRLTKTGFVRKISSLAGVADMVKLNNIKQEIYSQLCNLIGVTPNMTLSKNNKLQTMANDIFTLLLCYHEKKIRAEFLTLTLVNNKNNNNLSHLNEKVDAGFQEISTKIQGVLEALEKISEENNSLKAYIQDLEADGGKRKQRKINDENITFPKENNENSTIKNKDDNISISGNTTNTLVSECSKDRNENFEEIPDKTSVENKNNNSNNSLRNDKNNKTNNMKHSTFSQAVKRTLINGQSHLVMENQRLRKRSENNDGHTVSTG